VNKIEYGTEFLDQLKDSVHDLYDENKELKKEIERLNKIIEDLHKKLCDIQDFIEDEIKQLDDDKFLLRVLDLEEMLDIIKRS
jgi:predicted  nucleic acid-binding Zn-ribbon protein